MFLKPLLTIIRPKLDFPITQTRHLRPSIKISKDRFQVSIDVHQFTKDELRVKAKPEYLVVEGKQERKTKCERIFRQFIRKFKLPDGCDPGQIKSELSPEGILTITAQRKLYEKNVPCDTVIPISYCGPRKADEVLVVDMKKDPCDAINKSDNKP